MRSRTKWALLLSLAIGLALLGVLAGRGPQRPAVETARVEIRELTSTVSASGEVRPSQSVDVSAGISGRITAMLVKEGARVRRGDMLARIDSAQQEAKARQTEAAVASARADLESVGAELDEAQRNSARLTRMHNEGLISDQLWEVGVTELRVRQARVESQRRRVLQQEAALSSDLNDVEKSAVLAPMDGVVTRLSKQLGESVIGAQSFSPSVIMTVADLSQMQVRLRVSEVDIGLVRIGQKADIEVQVGDGIRLRGHVSDVGSSAVERTSSLASGPSMREFPVTVTIERPGAALLPGLTASVAIVVDHRDAVPSVPIQAVVVREDQPVAAGDKRSARQSPANEAGSRRISGVFVVEEGRAVFREVRTGITGDRHVEVTQGLAPGEVTVAGPYKVLRALRSGTPVTVR